MEQRDHTFFRNAWKNVNCVYDKYIGNTIVKLLYRKAVFNQIFASNI